MIVAINKDAEAPIFQVSDFGLVSISLEMLSKILLFCSLSILTPLLPSSQVADLFKAVPELTEKI